MSISALTHHVVRTQLSSRLLMEDFGRYAFDQAKRLLTGVTGEGLSAVKTTTLKLAEPRLVGHYPQAAQRRMTKIGEMNLPEGFQPISGTLLHEWHPLVPNPHISRVIVGSKHDIMGYNRQLWNDKLDIMHKRLDYDPVNGDLFDAHPLNNEIARYALVLGRNKDGLEELVCTARLLKRMDPNDPRFAAEHDGKFGEFIELGDAKDVYEGILPAPHSWFTGLTKRITNRDVRWGAITQVGTKVGPEYGGKGYAGAAQDALFEYAHPWGITEIVTTSTWGNTKPMFRAAQLGGWHGEVYPHFPSLYYHRGEPLYCVRAVFSRDRDFLMQDAHFRDDQGVLLQPFLENHTHYLEIVKKACETQGRHAGGGSVEKHIKKAAKA